LRISDAYSNMDKRPQPERRHQPRRDASWPVIVEANHGVLHLETVNVSPLGAKVKATAQLAEGTPVTLHFHPDDAPSFDVAAVVWRVDPDGLVFFFVGALE